MNEPTPEGPSTHDEGTGHGTTDSAASIEERTLTAVAHRSLWIGLFVAGAVNMGFALGWLLLLWLLPGAIWMATRDTLPFAAEHARQAMLLGGGLCALSLEHAVAGAYVGDLWRRNSVRGDPETGVAGGNGVVFARRDNGGVR
ncbi:hypothetical protein XocVXO32_18705 [Xanthomonas oryzae pv. oryzicola]|uniref:hypothetical protein n=1 Tax=Xanthomonas oryzae TaxID=347 RepID=UPI0012B0517E|nr:hypothetical protein [Xanthomonas oryzae]